MKIPKHPLGNVSVQKFLQEYWQQKPLLIRNAFPNYRCPISADEMAGLACEPDFESRIILERDGDDPWQCQHGPFDESVFSQLPDTHWTLLLQSCNLFIPAFSQLLEKFRFIPNWRVDDIMLSYAPVGGSVGPHTDNYDVFLLQAQGKRRWDISTRDYTDTDFVPDIDLKILKSFVPTQTWDLGPGDMLYLPPGVAHHGVALNDAVTISVGFRAPNYSELGNALLEDFLAQQSFSLPQSFYQDSALPLQENPGEISGWSLQRINDSIIEKIDSHLRANDWFGKFITDTEYDPEQLQTELSQQDYRQNLSDGQQLVRDENCKFAFIQDNKTVQFFRNGQVSYYPMSLLDLISLICNDRYPASDTLLTLLDGNDSMLFLGDLINQGYLYFDPNFSLGIDSHTEKSHGK